MPALRERRADIIEWIDRLWTTRWERRGEQPAPLPNFDPEVTEMLMLRPWNSNLREVDRLVHSLAAETSCHGRTVGIADLPRWCFEPIPATPKSSPVAESSPWCDGASPMPTREEFVLAFQELGGSVRGLARHFDRDRRQIYRWIEMYGLRA